MTTKHTPTPWYEDERKDGCFWDVSELIGTTYSPNKKANAALIVRAVNAHKELLEIIEQFVSSVNNTEAHNTTLANRARKAIAKAKGEV